MDTKNALYAAVGAPIAVAKNINERIGTLRHELGSRTEELSHTAQKRLEEWAEEGRQVVDKVSEGKMVDELAAKVDFDQAREQVSKLRDQLEDMLATWRASFRPAEETAGEAVRSAASALETAGDKVETATNEIEKTVRVKTTTRPAAKKTAAKKPAAKKPAAKKPAAKAASKAS
ncbi:MAG: hypothetical protein WB239_05485 [Acidimicrobiia bacterium]